VRRARALVAAACFLGPVACVPSGPRITHPVRVDAHCGTKQVRVTAIESIITSTDDRLATGARPSTENVRGDVSANGGVIAYWNDLLLLLPRTSRALGETDGYARVRAAAISTAPDAVTHRPIALYVRDHGTYRWIPMNAFGLQNVCVEGRREG
jgi:hypothetical protein